MNEPGMETGTSGSTLCKRLWYHHGDRTWVALLASGSLTLRWDLSWNKPYLLA